MTNKKLQVWLPLIFALVMIAGMYFGYKLRDQTGGKGFFKKEKGGSLAEAMEVIRRNYVDSINIDSLEGLAIREVINELDPHSVYLPPVELKAANEDLAGNFEGIGVQFYVFGDTVNVVYVIPQGPSDKAGLQVGDKIIKVNGSLLTGRNFNTDEIKQAIRGPRGSTVKLLVLRGKSLLKFDVTRGTIPVSAIDAAYMVDRSTGYIKLNKFTESSYEEFMRSLETLKKEGLKSLIYDLRGNGGGFMNEAVEMADEFLDGDKLIVYTKGVNSRKREYRCRRPGLFESGELIILLDEWSASASEVLAGALQDWDRATIIGRRSFGKGLVQDQYPLRDGSAIRLTIARYYTPLDRSIQRPYEKGRKVYMDEILDRYSTGELLLPDSNKVHNGKEYKTHNGKIVYGGGGIMPDIFVPIDTTRYQQPVTRLFNTDGFNRFVYNYYLQNQVTIDRYKTATEFAHNFHGEDGMWSGLVRYAATDTIDLSEVNEKNREDLKLRLKALLARFKWRSQGFYQVLNVDDAMVKKALEEIRK
jgi:carboxyl-terminal processing protease